MKQIPKMLNSNALCVKGNVFAYGEDLWIVGLG